MGMGWDGAFAYINRCSSQSALELHILGLGEQGGLAGRADSTSASLHCANKFSSFSRSKRRLFVFLSTFYHQRK